MELFREQKQLIVAQFLVRRGIMNQMHCIAMHDCDFLGSKTHVVWWSKIS